jgi:hypothetical protein
VITAMLICAGAGVLAWAFHGLWTDKTPDKPQDYQSQGQRGYHEGTANYPAPQCIPSREGHLTGANAERAWARMTQEEQAAFTNAFYNGVGGTHYNVQDMRPREEIPWTREWAEKYHPEYFQGGTPAETDTGRRGNEIDTAAHVPQRVGSAHGSRHGNELDHARDDKDAHWADRAIESGRHARESGGLLERWFSSRNDERESEEEIRK